jgi:hypothetical protein
VAEGATLGLDLGNLGSDVVYSAVVPAPDKTHLAAVDELDAGWEDPKEAAVDAGRAAYAKDASLDDLDAGWGDDEEDADPGGDDAKNPEPEELEEPEPPGLTPEQRRARKEELAARAAARKERARAQAIAKKEHRKARADAAAANKKKKQKNPARRECPSEPKPHTADIRTTDPRPPEPRRATPHKSKSRAMTIALMVLLALAATGSVVFLLRK